MGKIKCSLCFLQKQAKKSIFDPKIALRTERFDRARNSYFTAHFQMPTSSVVGLCTTVEILNRYMGEAAGSAD